MTAQRPLPGVGDCTVGSHQSCWPHAGVAPVSLTRLHLSAMLASDTVVEVQDTTARENYNKVVIHKRKCVPYVALTNNHSGLRVSSAGNNNR